MPLSIPNMYIILLNTSLLYNILVNYLMCVGKTTTTTTTITSKTHYSKVYISQYQIGT